MLPKSNASLSPFVVVLAAVSALTVAGCRPFAAVGEDCTDRACALGLDCISGVCVEPAVDAGTDAGETPQGECEADADCIIAGSADGRVCDDGVCGWQICSDDDQCGSRICDDGECAERTLCLGDDDCKEGLLCLEGTCRSPCAEDGDCGGALSVCVEGRCETQCFIDLMCLGGICEEGICQDAECGEDADCGSATEYCDSGRCVSFVPCIDDVDCFDADYRCNDLGRCELRPACFSDVECGLDALCRGGLCRPVDLCLLDSDCPDDDDECVAGRCVTAPDCRDNGDCAAGTVCLDTVCAAPTGMAGELVVLTPHGLCRANGSGACSLALFEGEVATLHLGAIDADGHPVEVPDVAAEVPTDLEATIAGATLGFSAVAASSQSLALSGGGLTHGALSVTVVAAASAALAVLVVDADTGAPLAGATVFAGDATEVTGADGLATFATAPGPDALGVSAIVVNAAGHEGALWAGISLDGDVRIALRPAASTPSTAAGATVSISSSGDEIGPVGLGVAFPSLTSASEVSIDALFGPTFLRPVEVPVIGSLPLGLPAAVTMEATLPVVGNQVIREEAYAAMPGGIRFITALESRRETDTLFGLLFGGGGQGLALQIATEADGADLLIEPIGDVTALPLVPDSDDLDGDGELGELRPDWAALPTLEVVPTQRPKERVGIAVPAAPAGALGEIFLVGGYDAPVGGFVVAGMATSTGETSTQLRVAGAPLGLTSARRVVVAEARFNDPGLESRAFARDESFAAAVDLGAFLAPPSGAFLLADLPQPGGSLLVLPGAGTATTYEVEVLGQGMTWRLYVPANASGGRSVALPAVVGPTGASVGRAAVHRLVGADPDAATASLYRPGAGPIRSPTDAAAATASAAQ